MSFEYEIKFYLKGNIRSPSIGTLYGLVRNPNFIT